VPRYHQLNRSVTQLRGGPFSIHIKGLDELQITHDNIMMESCNTSFQVHFQVNPREFAGAYNIASGRRRVSPCSNIPPMRARERNRRAASRRGLVLAKDGSKNLSWKYSTTRLLAFA
jgi:hypothetical protein